MTLIGARWTGIMGRSVRAVPLWSLRVGCGITAFALSGALGRAVAVTQSEPSQLPVLNRTEPVEVIMRLALASRR